MSRYSSYHETKYWTLPFRHPTGLQMLVLSITACQTHRAGLREKGERKAPEPLGTRQGSGCGSGSGQNIPRATVLGRQPLSFHLTLVNHNMAWEFKVSHIKNHILTLMFCLTWHLPACFTCAKAITDFFPLSLQFEFSTQQSVRIINYKIWQKWQSELEIGEQCEGEFLICWKPGPQTSYGPKCPFCTNL